MINLLEKDEIIQFNLDKNSAYRTINKEIKALKDLMANLDDSLSRALNLMYNTQGRIVLTGIGKSGIIAKKIVASLASTGSPAIFVHPAEASHGDLGMLTTEDTVIAISNSGESKELADILNYCKRFEIPIIAITKNPKSTLGKFSNIVLKLPDSEEACPLGLAPTSSTTATLVLGDVLTVALMERHHFSKNDFNQRHPGGKLGSILLKVSDLMHKNNELPILDVNSSLQAALLEMTSKRLGCVGFINDKKELIGILTDGDLRRILTANTLNQNVENLMTKNPKTISPDILASEALKIMHDRQITNLFVLDNNSHCPVGVIHIHDCLNSGVA
ncbi:MAG: SIS domain-containing protein [Candidatus Gastranaerophilaceae bacterium]